MSEKKMSEEQKKALDKYKANVKRLTIDFPPSDAALWEHIQKQPKKQTYIKDLIRADMERKNANQMCLYCGHSMSSDAPDGSEVLVCFNCAGHEGKEMIVGDDESCTNYNGCD